MSNLKNQDMKASIGNLHKLDIEKISSIYWVEPISFSGINKKSLFSQGLSSKLTINHGASL